MGVVQSTENPAVSIRQRHEELCDQVHRLAGDRPVTIIAVTKYALPEQMREAYAAGVRDFGENKIQDCLQKMDVFAKEGHTDVRWHFIGHLQTNKIPKTIGRFHLIHSVDSRRLAEKLSAANTEAGRVQPVLLQVNVSGEAAKHGFFPEELRGAMPELVQLKGIDIRGLMTMAPHTPDQGVVRGVFADLANLRDDLAALHRIDLPELSMGMSHDFVHALGLGATMIRIGSLLFQTYKNR